MKIVEREVEGDVSDAVLDALDDEDLEQDPALDELLYPYDETVFALGLTSPLIMWRRRTRAATSTRSASPSRTTRYDLYRAVDAPGRGACRKRRGSESPRRTRGSR